MKIKSITLLITLMIVTSCTIDKRLHYPGHYIAWKGKSSTKHQLLAENQLSEKNLNNEEDLSIQLMNQSTEEQVLQNDSDNLDKNTEDIVKESKCKEITVNVNSFREQKCDIMTLKNGNEIECKVIEVGTTEIKYKNCLNLEGPILVVNKNDVLFLKYANGTKEVISSSTTEKSNVNVNVYNTTKEPLKRKSQLVALLLCIFFGLIGVHRMYLGYVGLGIFYLLTGGFCGIGVLVDLILLISGGLKPKNSEYEDSF